MRNGPKRHCGGNGASRIDPDVPTQDQSTSIRYIRQPQPAPPAHFSHAGDSKANKKRGSTDNTADGQIATLTLVNDETGNQVTRWVYGTTLADSGVARKDLLRAKIYPMSDDSHAPIGNGWDGTYQRTEYGYNRQGDLVTKKDPNETVHEYAYDGFGRQIEDAVTAFGSGIDEVVKRIEPPPTPGLRREGSRGDEKGNS